MAANLISGETGLLDMDLEGVNAKIGRARHNLQTLESDIEEFCESERERILDRLRQGPPLVVESNEPELLVDYSVRTGEIAYNLRSGLDHLVWQLVLSNGGKPSARCEFPIFDCELKYRNAARKRLKGMSERHIAMIERFQPYREECEFGRHLRMLYLICNIDKHRHLNVINLASMADAHLKDDSVPPDLIHGWKSGLGLRFLLKGTGYEDHVETEVVTGVCFRDVELQEASPGYGSRLEGIGIDGPPVIKVLSSCLIAVSEVIREASKKAG